MNYIDLPYVLYLIYSVYSLDFRLITLVCCCYSLNKLNTNYISSCFESGGGFTYLNSILITRELPKLILQIVFSIVSAIYLINEDIPYITFLLRFHQILIILSNVCLLVCFVAVLIILNGLISLYNVNYGEKGNTYLTQFIENKLQDDQLRLQYIRYIQILNHYLIKFAKTKFISEVIIDRTYLIEKESDSMCRICEKKVELMYYKLKCDHTYHPECLRRWINEEDYCKVCEMIL